MSKNDEIKICEQDIINIKEENNPEYLGNKILYEMCERYPNHTKEQEIYAKVWIIGRTYAVALERGKRKDTHINDDFYKDVIVKTIMDSKFDSILEILKEYSDITENNIEDILTVYKQLIEITDKFDRGQKHSFCSKYLHFHFPNLFFIYDSRANESIRRCKFKIPKSYNKILTRNDKLPYYQFFIKCFLLRENINAMFNKTLSPREIDTFLIYKANERRRAGNEIDKS